MAKDSIITAPITKYDEYIERNKDSNPPVVETIKEPDFIKNVNLKEDYNTRRILHNELMEVKGIPYLFVTTPMLNLNTDNIKKDSYLSWMANTNPSVLSMLSYGNVQSNAYSTTNPFIPLLFNHALSFDAKDTVSKTKEVGETFYGYKLTLPAADVDSIVGDEVSIRYRDQQGLPVLHLHKTWFEYHNKVRRGLLAPSRDAILNHYLDYTSSIYFFLTEMDGETLQYWCKMTGVAPINVPYSVFGGEWNNHDIIEYTIQYVYSFKEDLNPDILLDFNKLTYGKSLELNYERTGGSVVNSITQKAQTGMLYSPYEGNAMKKPHIVLGTRQAENNTLGTPKYKLIFT